jgi:hypothetical protein
MDEEDTKGQEGLDTSDNEDAQGGDDTKEGFLKGDEKDMQRLASGLGRALKTSGDNQKTLTQIQASLTAIAERLDEKPTVQDSPGLSGNGGADPLAELGDNIQSALLSGGKEAVVAAENLVNLVLDARSQKENGALKQADKILSGFDGQPFFKDIEQDVRTAAANYVASGMDPEVAAKLAFSEKRSDYFGAMLATVNKTNPAALETLKSGGNSKPSVEKPKLPPEFAEACKKEIAAGNFKDEDEYIEFLSPSIRKQHGL